MTNTINNDVLIVSTTPSATHALRVNGGARLHGTIKVAGFKHSLVTVLAAACAAHARTVITNCPAVTETSALAAMINELGGFAHYDSGSLTIDASTLSGGILPDESTNRIHGSVYLVPALLGRSGEAVISTGGGCQIGDSPGGRRPIEHYVSVLERFDAQVAVHDARRLVVRSRRLVGCEIDLLDYTADRELRTGPLYSGASKMAILTAAVAYGTSVLHNPYPKPDVTDLVRVLGEFGADIEHTATGSLIVHGRGPDALNRPVRHTLLSDLIEIVTWICAGALLADAPLRVRGTRLASACAALQPELDAMDRIGIRMDIGRDELAVHPVESLCGNDIVVTSVGIFSDSQPFFALLSCHADATSTITETVWSHRFGYLPGLRTLGARLNQHGATVTIHGPCPPRVPGHRIRAADLRAAAVLLLAALCVAGATVVTGTQHLARGYPNFAGSLVALGADIEPEMDRLGCATSRF